MKKTNLASHITDSTPLSGLRLLTMKTGVKDIVTITGSFLGGNSFSPKENPSIATMTARVLDEGTKQHTKIEIREMLESVGASMSFGCDQRHVNFEATCLTKDVSMVLELLAEQLREPAFNSKEVELEKKKAITGMQEAKDDPNTLAKIRFTQLLFPKGHPNYAHDLDASIEQVQKITPENLSKYHEKSYGLGDFTMVAVGDFDQKAFASQVAKVFAGWKKSPLKFTQAISGKHIPAQEYVTLPDKASSTLYIGKTLPIDRNHPDCVPLLVGTFVLGGNFPARLMMTVRDQQGLTYGVYSHLGGMGTNDPGYWYVIATFAPALLQKGLVAVMEQVNRWVKKGITSAELSLNKETLIGSYQVGLATTEGMAETILDVVERGKPLEYLDEISGIISGVKLPEVNAIIHKHIDLKQLVMVACGSIDAAGVPLEKK